MHREKFPRRVTLQTEFGLAMRHFLQLHLDLGFVIYLTLYRSKYHGIGLGSHT